MSIHEYKKDCKIIDEITLFLMKNGYLKLNIDIDFNDDAFVFVIKTTKCDEEIINTIEEEMNVPREHEIEEYGWELMGESDAQSELGLVGRLIDSVTIDNSCENETSFTFVRKNS